jgi:hypothetical protein
MKSHRHQRDLALVYIAFILAAVLWFTYLLNGMPHSPPSPPTLRNPIHDARPVPAPAPTPQPHRDRVIYEARN